MISFIYNFYFIIEGYMDLVSVFTLFKSAVRALAGVHKTLHLNVCIHQNIWKARVCDDNHPRFMGPWTVLHFLT